MIGYKDRWWCGSSDTCRKAPGCDRVLTTEEKRKATKWWGNEDFPYSSIATPSCYSPKSEAEDERKES